MTQNNHPLPEGPNAVLALAAPILTRHLGEGAFALGGGTALACVWQHRHSTDVNLFMDAETYRQVSLVDEKRQAFERDLDQILRPSNLEVSRGFLKLHTPQGELSLSTSPPPMSCPNPNPRRLAGPGVPLEPPQLNSGQEAVRTNA